MPLAALSFDADKTLWNPHGVYRKGLEATVEAMTQRGDIEPGQVTVEMLASAREFVRADFRGTSHRMEDIRERSFSYVLEQLGHVAPERAAAELIGPYLEVRFAVVELYPEVREVLARLKARYRLGLLTNGNTYPDRCGLPGVFDAEVFSSEHGLEKPDVRAFEIIAAELGVPTSAMVHIGDDWDDVEGANAAGATSVVIVRSGERPPWANDADHEVCDLHGLEAVLDALA